MREFFKYTYYIMNVLVIITMGLFVVSGERFATIYWLTCASLWTILWLGLMLTRPVEYLYLIAYWCDNRLGRHTMSITYKFDTIAKIDEMEDYLKRINNANNVGIQSIQLISKTYHE